MTAAEYFSQLGIESSFAALGTEWKESEKTFPNTVGFLEPDFIRRACGKFIGNDEILQTLLASAERIKKNPFALRFMWHQYYLVVQNYEKHFYKCYRFPDMTALGADARAYYLLLALSGYSLHGDWHAKHGIPERYIAMAVEDFKESIRASVNATGLIGLAGHYSGWWQGLFNGKLYRLGRLTFLQEKYRIFARVFENRKTKQIQILSDPNLIYTSDGLIALSEDDKRNGWTSVLEESDAQITGHPITPEGLARNRKITLNKTDWMDVVVKDDDVIGVHISPGCPMAIPPCIESFKEALAFNAEYFSEIRFKAFVCDSWLLDPNLEKVQPPESNIVQFQRRYYLVPSPNDFEFVTIRTIFGNDALKNGIESVSHATSLQKRAAEFKRRGGHFRSGLGIFPWTEWGKPTH